MNRVLDASTPEGKALRATFSGMAKDFGTWLKGAATPENITKFVSAFADLAKGIAQVTTGLVGGFGEGLGEILGPLKEVMQEFGGGSGGVLTLGDAFKVIGKALGYVVGIFVYGFGAIAMVIYGLVEVVRVCAKWISSHFEYIKTAWLVMAAPFLSMAAVVGAAIAAIVAFVVGLAVGIYQAVKWVVENIGAFLTWIGGLGKKALQLGKDFVAGIGKGIADAWDTLIGNTENLADKLP
jgi:hypothetical protein